MSLLTQIRDAESIDELLRRLAEGSLAWQSLLAVVDDGVPPSDPSHEPLAELAKGLWGLREGELLTAMRSLDAAFADQDARVAYAFLLQRGQGVGEEAFESQVAYQYCVELPDRTVSFECNFLQLADLAVAERVSAFPDDVKRNRLDALGMLELSERDSRAAIAPGEAGLALEEYAGRLVHEGFEDALFAYVSLCNPITAYHRFVEHHSLLRTDFVCLSIRAVTAASLGDATMARQDIARLADKDEPLAQQAIAQAYFYLGEYEAAARVCKRLMTNASSEFVEEHEHFKHITLAVLVASQSLAGLSMDEDADAELFELAKENRNAFLAADEFIAAMERVPDRWVELDIAWSQ